MSASNPVLPALAFAAALAVSAQTLAQNPPLVTDADIASRTSFALKIDAVTDAARPLALKHAPSDDIKAE